MMKKVIAPKHLHRPFGHAHAIQIDKTVYISGQIPLDQEMNVIGNNDIAQQTDRVYENLKKGHRRCGRDDDQYRHAEPRKFHSELGSESLQGSLGSASNKIKELQNPETSSL